MTHKIIKKGILADSTISKEAKDIYCTIEDLGGILLKEGFLKGMGHEDYEKPLQELVDAGYVEDLEKDFDYPEEETTLADLIDDEEKRDDFSWEDKDDKSINN